MPGASGRIQAFGGLSSLLQGFFFAKMCVSGFLDLHLVRFSQIWSDFVKDVSGVARFCQIWTDLASQPAPPQNQTGQVSVRLSRARLVPDWACLSDWPANLPDWPSTTQKYVISFIYNVSLLDAMYFALLCFALPCLALACLALLCVALICLALLCFPFLSFALLCFSLLCFALLCFALLFFALCCFALAAANTPNRPNPRVQHAQG